MECGSSRKRSALTATRIPVGQRIPWRMVPFPPAMTRVVGSISTSPLRLVADSKQRHGSLIPPLTQLQAGTQRGPVCFIPGFQPHASGVPGQETAAYCLPGRTGRKCMHGLFGLYSTPSYAPMNSGEMTLLYFIRFQRKQGKSCHRIPLSSCMMFAVPSSHQTENNCIIVSQ